MQWQPREPMAVLWEPSAYNEPEATRVNISFAPSPEALKELHVFDAWSVETLSAESARLFGTNLDLEEVKRRCQPALRGQRKGGGYQPPVQDEPCWPERREVLGHFPQPPLAARILDQLRRDSPDRP